MPVRQLVHPRPLEYAPLVDRLADEWRSPNAAAAEPMILEEADAAGRLARVYVVWGAWAHLSREARGEIIMDAAERVRPREDVLNVTVAMGLTPDEADRFGLKWR